MMGADGLVLSAEAVIGKHPMQAGDMIRLLIDEAVTRDPEPPPEDLLDELPSRALSK